MKQWQSVKEAVSPVVLVREAGAREQQQVGLLWCGS